MRVCIVAAVLWLQYVIHVMLFPMMNVLYIHIRTFRSMCSVPFVVAFCSSLVSCLTGIWSGYFLNNTEMVPSAPVTLVWVSPFIFRIHSIYVVSHFENLSDLPFNHVFAKLRKATASTVMSFSRPHGTTRLTLDGLSGSLIFEIFSKM